jgi:hypothetical protein
MHQAPPEPPGQVVSVDAAACASQADRRYRASWRGRRVYTERIKKKISDASRFSATGGG